MFCKLKKKVIYYLNVNIHIDKIYSFDDAV